MKEIKILLRDLLQAGLKFAFAYPLFLVIVLSLVPVVKFTWILILKVWNLW